MARRDIITVSGIRALALLMTDDASMMNGLKVNVSVRSTLGKYVRVGQHRPANGAYSIRHIEHPPLTVYQMTCEDFYLAVLTRRG